MCKLGEEATSTISRAHLISALPLVQPTGEKGFVLITKQALQLGQEHVGRLGLRQERVHGAQFALGQRAVGGQKHDRDMRVDALHLLGNHVPTSPGHLIVEHHRIHSARDKQLEPFIHAAGFEDFIAVLLEHHFARNEPFPVIVDAEDGCLGARHDFVYYSANPDWNRSAAHFRPETAMAELRSGGQMHSESGVANAQITKGHMREQLPWGRFVKGPNALSS